MSSTPKKSTEAEDVLEFLNSLPESNDDKITNKGTNKGNDDDILDFLDELEANDSKIKKNKIVKNENNNNNDDENLKQKDEVKNKPIESVTIKQSITNKSEIENPNIKNDEKSLNNDNQDIQEKEQEEEEGEEDFVDPITSISNWWSSSGAKTVNSIWSNATSQASNFREKAQHEALQINEQLKKIQINEFNDQLTKTLNETTPSITVPNTRMGINFLNTVYDSLVNNGEGETLKINLIYDLENFNDLDSLIYNNFRKVLKQVEGGIKIEIKDNSNSKRRKSISKNYEDLNKRNLNLFQGKLIDGEKLLLANLENYINSYKINELGNDSEDQNISHLFLSILAIQIKSDHKLSSSVESKSESEIKQINIDSNNDSSFSFLILLKDLTNNIEVKTRSQGLPIKWANWLDGSIAKTSEEIKEQEEKEEGIDPAEWVKNWVDDSLSLSFGILSQSYVVERMGY
ncbi:hypothetical protein WICMUC_002625 [Wickerhamomyces mucosus]|uniref:Maintenance of telomere capping protein 1 n=1 Tax=Wickerhamomyces mucosus TaxID=1378264 RepID=A0A9P8PNY1_9ASCO|nr:hypothetical protein WICMUC_002625 [Wickerhamomyces mucosus]